jgi:hypothetical protein
MVVPEALKMINQALHQGAQAAPKHNDRGAGAFEDMIDHVDGIRDV